MFEKYRQKFRREILKRDVRHLREIIRRYNLDLYIADIDKVLFKIDSNDNLMHLLRERTYLDGKISTIVKNQLSVGEVAIDVGANFGLVSSLLSRKYNKVYAFEPEEENLERMRDLFKQNYIRNVEVIPLAASDKSGELTFFVADATSHHSLGLSHESQSIEKTVKVNAITLDEFCDKNSIDQVDLLKVDVEGFEKEVLDGAKGLLENRKIKQVVFEISIGVVERLGRDPLEVPRVLSQFGFIIYDHKGEKQTLDQLSKSFLDQDLFARLD